jgi:hypothetical protein
VLPLLASTWWASGNWVALMVATPLMLVCCVVAAAVGFLHLNRPAAVPCHVFLDNSNVFLSLRSLNPTRRLNARAALPFMQREPPPLDLDDHHHHNHHHHHSSTTPEQVAAAVWHRLAAWWHALTPTRFHFSRARSLRTAFLMGSTPPPSAAVWGHFSRAGWEVDTFERARGFGEQGVDEMLHLRMANCVHNNAPGWLWRCAARLGLLRRPVLVLASGDGNDNGGRGGGSGFPTYLRRALDRGFDVNVFAVSTACSSEFARLQGEYPAGRVRVVFLDDAAHLDEVSFCK